MQCVRGLQLNVIALRALLGHRSGRVVRGVVVRRHMSGSVLIDRFRIGAGGSFWVAPGVQKVSRKEYDTALRALLRLSDPGRSHGFRRPGVVVFRCSDED